MNDLRIWKGVERGQAFELKVDGMRIKAYEGETVAAALMAAGIRITHRTPKDDQSRGVCCGIGLCYSCTMIIDGVPNMRTCQTLARPGMRLETQKGLQRWKVGK